ncbi:MAG TPA: efflux transporter periplasmic adaptor subunit, partial [Clostridium sp.]|nr:efflux transporter periplasmic adaptor subunit [Clostridium sp.]
MERFKNDVEETGGSAEMEQMSDEAFDKELQNLMEEANSGKKKKKKGSRKKWSKKRKIITIGAAAIGAFFIAFKVLAG